MNWTDADSKALREYRNRIDDDNIRYKQIVKKKLINNPFIIHVLANKELEEADAEPDEYIGENIRPAYMIPEVQTVSKNYICFTAGYKDIPQWNKSQKYMQLTFVILVEQKNLIDPETTLARHDLLAALIKDEFNWSLDFGERIHCVSDLESVTDNNYATRTLIFETMMDNNLVKTKNGVPTIVNHRMDEF